jgi:hypothetical protein
MNAKTPRTPRKEEREEEPTGKEFPMPYDDEDPPFVEPDAELDALSGAAIGAAIEVHRGLGPGLDEGLYAGAYRVELGRRGISFACEVMIPVEYKGELIGTKRITS